MGVWSGGGAWEGGSVFNNFDLFGGSGLEVVPGVACGHGGWGGQRGLEVGRWGQGDVVGGFGAGGWDLPIFYHFGGRGIGDCIRG